MYIIESLPILPALQFDLMPAAVKCAGRELALPVLPALLPPRSCWIIVKMSTQTILLVINHSSVPWLIVGNHGRLVGHFVI